MKITIDYEDGTEAREYRIEGAHGVLHLGSWVTLKLKHPKTGEYFHAEVWDRGDEPVSVNKASWLSGLSK